jgi:hypothetical protein
MDQRGRRLAQLRGFGSVEQVKPCSVMRAGAPTGGLSDQGRRTEK